MTDARVTSLRPTTDRRAPAHAALAAALRRAGGFDDVAADKIEPLPVRGLQHRLYRVTGLVREGAGVLLRVPRQSHWGLLPADNLAYQAEAFRRAALADVPPRLFAVLPPDAELPWGALAVEEIAGVEPRLPEHLPAIADALFAIHMLPVPGSKAPLIEQPDTVVATLATIEQQARSLDAAGLSADALLQIEDERRWARAYAESVVGQREPRTLVLTDTQPGNFVVEPSGIARAVDLEKAMYGSPTIDLAHATIEPSTRWDNRVDWVPEPDAVARFYKRYLARSPAAYASALRPWLKPARRLVFLRTITIFARMAAADRRGDWSGLDLDPAFLEHTRAHIARCHDAERLRAMRAEWLDPGHEIDLG
ncbi:MAG: aminoglycoside phosphotransferase [Alphaproteobacteria bacterium]|nr:aminoglycoside phosphotransferase [Alphaproteobacteria bacterium]